MKEEWLYPADLEAAKRAQQEMANQVNLKDSIKDFSLIGGMDVSCKPFDPEQRLFGVCVTLSINDLTVIEVASTEQREAFPYISGFLGFREAPALIAAYRKLQHKPGLILIDGHGISHPRGLGIASQIGVLLNTPTIGVAKSILVGAPEEPLGDEVGSLVPLCWKGKTIAMVMRTKKRCQPLIISAGHKISLERAVQVVQQCQKGYRLPEPTRQAHLASNVYRKAHLT